MKNLPIGVRIRSFYNWRIRFPLERKFRKNNFITYAEKEFKIMKETGKDYLILPYEKEIKKIVKKYSKLGQSGGSNPFTSGAVSSSIRNLLRFKPITPIYDNEDAWLEPSGGASGSRQCKRLSGLFKEPSGEAYYLDAIIFRDIEDGTTFTGSVEGINSRNCVNFPFIPKSFYIDVREEKEELLEDYEERELYDHNYKIVDKTQLEKVWEVYKKK